MKITKRQLRRLIRESITIKEGTLWVSKSPYGGMSVEDDDDNDIGVGEMVMTLIEAGDDDIFQSAQGVDPKSLEKMMAQHDQGVQGGLEKWDSDVFSDYYNVDLDRVVKLYARRMNFSIKEVESENEDY